MRLDFEEKKLVNICSCKGIITLAVMYVRNLVLMSIKLTSVFTLENL